MLATVSKATKVDKKAIMRFYKAQHYTASYIGQDHGYIVKCGEDIIASAIISAGQEKGSYWLLHGLVTDMAHRGNGIASLILQAIFSEKNPLSQAKFTKIICFAEPKLQPLYLSNHFITYNTENEIAQLPHEFKQRFKRYREKHKSLTCFLYCATN
ncbi:MAG: GNAT family N-acetyltransferase [Cognaticolwellia sp.]